MAPRLETPRNPPEFYETPLSLQVVEQEGGGYLCEYDGKVYPTMTRRYILGARVADETGELYVQVFNDQVGPQLPNFNKIWGSGMGAGGRANGTGKLYVQVTSHVCVSFGRGRGGGSMCRSTLTR